MKQDLPGKINLADYKPPDYLISDISMEFNLLEDYTEVRSTLTLKKNGSGDELFLNGEGLELKEIKVNGNTLSAEKYVLAEKGLVLNKPQDEFTLETLVRIEPQNNKALEGLYKSGDIFCTQNEAEGFRHITFYLDRPDVMSCFRTKIMADKAKYPVLLSNGNPVAKGELANGRHFVTWEDPYPKPCYLYALVAGDLAMIEDKFKTMSGRDIALRIFVDKGNEDRSEHALRSLKKAMKWDEDTFGLEYDLDVYMIVAVDAFNFGAMENKGLNIFNSQCVLANPKTATDSDFQYIEEVVGHEYFHNWTGNRVTCRDWFQITLKEGLTVFRDQEFSADMTSRPVKRIADVRMLKDIQFVEDGGPNAHPIRPQSYIEVNNFYTPTVYSKGSEVIRMIHTLIGKENFCKGMQKYFELFDGQAVTTEDFVHAMELASGMDLTQFKNWYEQAGTPVCEIKTGYEAGKKQFKLTARQVKPAVIKGDPYLLRHFPLSLGLLDEKGKDIIGTKVLQITKEEETFVFDNISERPVPSLLRNASAPVLLKSDLTEGDLLFLLRHDTNEFVRYDAGQRLATDALNDLVGAFQRKESPGINKDVIHAFGTLLSDAAVDEAFKAEALVMPSVTSLTESMDICDFEAAFKARETFLEVLAAEYRQQWTQLYERLQTARTYAIDAASVGRRALKNLALNYLIRLEDSGARHLALEQFKGATNMTDEFAAFAALCQTESAERDEAVQAFYEKWKKDALVMNKWLAVQAGAKTAGTLVRVAALEKDPVFDFKNPNKIRSLFGVFAQNLIRFHDASGAGYSLIADKVIDINAFNPSAAAKLSSAFKKFAKLDPSRKAHMEEALKRILQVKGLSRDVFEIVSKTLESSDKPREEVKS